MHWIFVRVLGCWVLLSKIVDASLTGLHQREYHALGTRVVLSCTSTTVDQPINWEFRQHNHTSYRWIFLNGVMTRGEEENYEVQSDNGRCLLIIRRLDWRHAGEYKCTEDAGLGQSATTELVVIAPSRDCASEHLENGPSCSSTFLICKFYYVGQSAPPWIDRTTLNDSERTVHPVNAMFLNFTVEQSCNSTHNATSSVSIWDHALSHVNIMLLAVALSFTLLTIILVSYIVHLKRVTAKLMSLQGVPKAKLSPALDAHCQATEITYASIMNEVSAYNVPRVFILGDESETRMEPGTANQADELGASDYESTTTVQRIPDVYERLHMASRSSSKN